MAHTLPTYGIVLARCLLALIFLLNAVGVIDQAKPAQELTERGVPAPAVPLLMWAGRVLQCAAGLALLSGVWQRVAALALIAFLVPATVMAHPFWLDHTSARRLQLMNFMKNLAMIGGLLLLPRSRLEKTRTERGRAPSRRWVQKGHRHGHQSRNRAGRAAETPRSPHVATGENLRSLSEESTLETQNIVFGTTGAKSGLHHTCGCADFLTPSSWPPCRAYRLSPLVLGAGSSATTVSIALGRN
jgi:putative oxidoreductase